MNSSDGDGISPEDAFELLGHETRLAILHVLWEEQDLDSVTLEPHLGSAVSFTTLRKRVGMRDGSQFNYHLKKLVGRFVHATGDGYVLRRAGQQVTSAILAGGLTEEVVLDRVPIADPCPLCDGRVVIEYGTERTLDWLVCRCTACEGAWEVPGFPSGVLMLVDPLEPVGFRTRTPDEIYRALVTRTVHDFTLVTKGVCPSCSGPISASPQICADHVVEAGKLCATCGTIFEVRFHCICEVCNRGWHSASDRHFVTHPTVHAFYHEHGYDPFGHEWPKIGAETIADQTVVSDDPMEIRTDVRVDGERLTVILDESGMVVDVTE